MAESNELRRQIVENMEGMSTEDLERIWSENDRAAWSDMAFEVIGDILQKRTGQLSPQENYEEKVEKARAAEREAEEETYYSFWRVEKIGSLADLAAPIVLIGYLVDWGLDLYRQFQGFNPQNLGVWLTNLAIVGVSRVFYAIYLFVILKAIAQAIYLLVDIEDNTRTARRDAKAREVAR